LQELQDSVAGKRQTSHLSLDFSSHSSSVSIAVSITVFNSWAALNEASIFWETHYLMTYFSVTIIETNLRQHTN
jgi:hypothetical protein